GFDPQNVLTAQVVLPGAKYTSDERIATFFSALGQRLEATGRTRSVAFTSDGPLGGSYNYISFQVVGQPAPLPGQNSPDAIPTVTSPDYFPAFKIPLVAGRLFTASDGPNAPRVVHVHRGLSEE